MVKLKEEKKNKEKIFNQKVLFKDLESVDKINKEKEEDGVKIDQKTYWIIKQKNLMLEGQDDTWVTIKIFNEIGIMNSFKKG